MHFIWSILFTLTLLASPVEQMKKRAGFYHEGKSSEHCIEAMNNLDYTVSDAGLMTNVSCEFSCSGGAKQSKKIAANFTPSSFGLYPGDGSSDKNTLWRSLTPTMKAWSEEVCLQQATAVCKDITKVSASDAKSITSGEWKLDHHPGCQEKKAIYSPFDSSVKSNKIAASMVKAFEISNKAHSLNFYDKIYKAALVKPGSTCKKKLNVDLCFGDCVYEVTKGGAWKETLATPKPLGTEKSTWCMDGFVNVISQEKALPLHVKVKLCEAYFWSHLMHSKGLGSSCAAIRGTLDCSKLIQSF